jgi:DNA-binding PadR family transcriptional regulator
MLATRSWTGYELTHQVRRSLRFIWPVSEAHLYREQKRLVDLGWATVEEEAAGQRSRKRYTITRAGRRALAEWLATEPDEPHFQVEGVLRTFYGNFTTTETLVDTMTATVHSTRGMLVEMLGFVDEYLAEGGPLDMLESGTRGTFRGREMYPDRLHVVALAIDVTTRLLETLDDFFATAAEETAAWPSPSDPSITAATRARLERIRERNVRKSARPPRPRVHGSS